MSSFDYFDKTKLSQIDIRSKNIVNGYIRQYESTLNHKIIIPDLINYICLSYFFILQLKWNKDLFTKKWIIMKHSNTIKKNVKNHIWNAAFLSVVIKPNFGTFDCKFKWFKGNLLRVGIWKNSFDPQIILKNGADPFEPDDEQKASYGYSVDMGMILNPDRIGYGPSYTYKPSDNNSQVGIHLDFNKLELSFSFNGKNNGKAYNIKKCDYKIVISMFLNDSKIQIINDDE